MAMIKRNWQFILGVLISVFFLSLSLHKFDFSRLRESLSQVNYRWFLLVVGLIFLSFLLRAFRWRYFLLPLKRTAFANAYHATVTGFFINNIYPFRLGEFVRAYLMGEREQIDKAATFATVIWERIFDGFALLPIFFLLHFTPFELPGWLVQGIRFVFIVYGIILAGVLGVIFRPEQTEKVIQWCIRFFPLGLQKTAASFLMMLWHSTLIITSWRILIKTVFISLLLMVCIYGSVFILVYAYFGPGIHWSAAALLLIAVSLAVVLPSSPGYVGTFHFASIITLRLFGCEANAAMGFAFVFHAVQYFPVILLGICSIVAMKLTVKELTTDAQKEQDLWQQEFKEGDDGRV